MKIDVDDEVYAWLAARVKGFESPNDVLRREVLGAPTAKSKSSSDREKGSLWAYITAGLIEPGDELIHIQKRKGNTFRGAVDADGWIVTDLGRYKQPSPALRVQTGSEINGWGQWTHVKSGKKLHELKANSDGATD